MFADPLAERLAAFVRDIGLPVHTAALPADTFLPGLDIRDGALVVDELRLAHPGDILHEAGHIAVADPAERGAPRLSPNGGDEMASIAWSYAALRYLDLDPAIVFHPEGYKGGSAAIIAAFASGNYFGVPLLHSYAMTYEPRHATAKGVAPFPHMLRWVR